ncbi:DUF4783 domain-containing protein [Sediminibacterium ginsengisoli]|uniref:DUF4783 domain-containing protein n=1 Tax=Sediminibacterium ginsengisoli TaxID=413434 RepID=A0A1T4JWE7_9BACT|nr:DUF4783 domain-containing protein [Sediminibacterium ginsengisoli]SJZ34395.1 protein of unknown function [Sediminibacterium ginsengisoli]
MKRFFLIAGLSLFLMSFTYFQDSGAIIEALKSTDVSKISSYFDDYVDLKIMEKDEVKNMGRNQAGVLLRSFFSENGVKAFEKISDRQLGNTMYVTGKLTGNNKNYNITLLLRAKDGKYQILTIRIS